MSIYLCLSPLPADGCLSANKEQAEPRQCERKPLFSPLRWYRSVARDIRCRHCAADQTYCGPSVRIPVPYSQAFSAALRWRVDLLLGRKTCVFLRPSSPSPIVTRFHANVSGFSYPSVPKSLTAHWVPAQMGSTCTADCRR